MNKNTKKTAATIIVVGGVTVVAAKTMNHYHQDIYNRFPELDRKIGRKAFRRFLWHSFTQQTGDLQDLTDEQMDVLFLEEVRKLTNPE